MITHPIKPVFDENSRILILGSFPSVKSREAAFFYGHPQNRFWRVISAVLEADEPQTIEEKRSLLLKKRIAVWDVIASCDITGSSDSSIRNVKPNDIGKILDSADVKAIFTNGKTAGKYYDKYIKNTIGRDSIPLPSTSPANAGFSLERLALTWKKEINIYKSEE